MPERWYTFWIIIGILCIIYGIIISRTGSGTGFFLVWIALGVLAFLCMAAGRAGLWQKLPAVMRIVLIAALILILAAFAAAEVRILTKFGGKGAEDLDYIIVPGAQVYEHGPSRVLKHRLDAAADYLLENDRTICIVSGGQGYNEPAPEADIMARYLEKERGIAGNRIVREARSENTVQNIRYCMELPASILSPDAAGAKGMMSEAAGDEREKRETIRLIDPEQNRIGIVTNDFHLYRASAIAEKAGLRNISGIAAPSNRLYLPNNLLREFFGVFKDVVKGNMQF